MKRTSGEFVIATIVLMLLAMVTLGQAQRGGRGGGAPAAAPNAGRGAAAVPPTAPTPKALIPNAKPVRSCESLKSLTFPNTSIESAAPDPNAPDVCRVVAISTHPPMEDRVTIWVAIPTSNWNGRFTGTGGGGFSGGSSPSSTGGPVAQGYATGGTDTGHSGGSGSFALGADGKPQWQLIRDNGHLGIHEMSVTGKALTEAMYGVAPAKSYFNGCLHGGRQGQMEAQRYPQDYDGIMSGSPAINWQKLHPQQMWGTVLMNAENDPIPQCKMATATAAAIESCDAIDGVKDGVIEDPERCKFDPKALIGKSAGEDTCGNVPRRRTPPSFKNFGTDLGPQKELAAFRGYGSASRGGNDFALGCAGNST